MKEERVILHCDCNGYFASIETLLNPALKDIPMAVAGDPRNRHGIILAKNELAKSFGIQTAETISQAKRKCPNLTLVPPHHDLYRAYSEKINQIYLAYTDYVEPFSIDESFLDVSALWQKFSPSPRDLADRIRQRVKEEIGITISIGVSFNKVFAKLASDLKKPDATTVIPRSQMESLVWPLDITSLLYVGKVTAQKLRSLNINTIGDIARTDPDFLFSYLGKQGQTLSLYARGLDQSPVVRFDQQEEAKSIGNGQTFREDLNSINQLKDGLIPLVEEVSQRLVEAKKLAYVIQVQIKSFDFKVSSKQISLRDPVRSVDEIRKIVNRLLEELWDRQTPVRLLAVTANKLVDEDEASFQPSLFDWQAKVEAQEEKVLADKKKQELSSLIEELNKQLGSDKVRLGRENR